MNKELDEIDAQIAKRILGWVEHGDAAATYRTHGCDYYGPEGTPEQGYHQGFPEFTRNLEDAMRVERMMSLRGFYLVAQRVSGGWRCDFRKWLPERDVKGRWHEWTAFAGSDRESDDGHDLLPLAICRAALATSDVLDPTKVGNSSD